MLSHCICCEVDEDYIKTVLCGGEKNVLKSEQFNGGFELK